MPPSACSKRPRRSSRGAGERALLVAEQLRFEQVGRERRRVERDERLRGARAVPVQRARHEFLAGARLARDEHRHAGAREAADRAEHLLHRRRVAEHLGDAPRLDGRGRGAVALHGRAPHEFDGLVDVEGLRQVLEGAALVGRDRALEVGMRRHHDHRQARPLAADFLEQVEPAAPGHADVGDQHVRLLARERREHGVGILEGRGLHAALLERALQHPADRGVVVDEPDVKCFRRVHGCRTAGGW